MIWPPFHIDAQDQVGAIYSAGLLTDIMAGRVVYQLKPLPGCLCVFLKIVVQGKRALTIPEKAGSMSLGAVSFREAQFVTVWFRTDPRAECESFSKIYAFWRKSNSRVQLHTVHCSLHHFEK